MLDQPVKPILDKTKALQGLTPKQERFALLINAGAESATDAYRQVYNVRSGTPVEHVWTQANKVKSNAKVAARIQQLSKANEGEYRLDASKTTEKVFKNLVRVMDDHDHKDNMKATIALMRVPALGIMKEPDDDAQGDGLKDSDLRKRLVASLDKLIASERDKLAKASDKAKVIDHDDEG